MEKKTFRCGFELIASFFIFIGSCSALAAQGARLDADTELKEGPGAKFRTILKLKKTELVVASNLPIEGYFKIRTAKGAIGWVNSDHLIPAKRTALPPNPANVELETGQPASVEAGSLEETNAPPSAPSD